MLKKQERTALGENILPMWVSLQQRKLCGLIEGEELFIKYMTLPRVKKKQLPFVIENELNYLYESTKQITFTYTVVRESLQAMEVMVFCVHAERKKSFGKGASFQPMQNKVQAIQFRFLEYASSFISETNYGLLFAYKEHLYLLRCCKGQLIGNKVIKQYRKYLEGEIAREGRGFFTEVLPGGVEVEKLYGINIEAAILQKEMPKEMPKILLPEWTEERILQYRKKG